MHAAICFQQRKPIFCLSSQAQNESLAKKLDLYCVCIGQR